MMYILKWLVYKFWFTLAKMKFRTSWRIFFLKKAMHIDLDSYWVIDLPLDDK
jgi:hypothetical protein